MKKSKVLALTLTALLSLALLLCGCGAKEEAQEPAEEEIALNTIGDPVEGDNVFVVNLTNGTDREITGFAVKEAEEKDFSANMLAEGDVFAPGEERVLYFDASAAADAEGAGEEGFELEPAFDIQLTLKAEEEGGEDTVLVLHQFPFGDMTGGQLCLEDEVAFVTYTSAATEEEISTKDAELKLKADEEAAAAAKNKPASKESSSSSNSYASESGGGDSEPAPASEPAPEPAPAQDTPDDSGCIGDEGLVY